ncbi:MAG: chromosome segregation protein SMC [Clostridia bacterium]|nr:chromosome segregation protein SMC [Clostridia bacterium]
MRLKKLELYGFKSFATRTEIVFNEGITGIVGPNGSGKSNIADAVRWVLGEQSAKTLRGASMSDVIFNGTQRRKPQSYCEVSLVFDNADHSLPVDFEEVMVTRRVFRSGESDYFLNRSACRLKDIIDLFRDTGIGREGYSIIGQGRIDDILSRKSEDRRQVFEEAAGIVKFRSRKEEADRHLERTLENAARVDDILEELGTRLAPLEEQSRAARAFLELSGEMKGLELNLFLVRAERWRIRLAKIDEEMTNLRTALSDTEAALGDKARARDACQERIAGLEERISQLRDELMRASETLHQTQSALLTVSSRLENRAVNRAQLDEQQTRDEERLKELTALREAGESGIAEREEQIAQAEESLSQAQAEEISARQEEEASETALESHKEKVLSAINRLSAVRNDQTRLRTMRGQMSSRLEELKATVRDAETEEQTLLAAQEEAQSLLKAEEERLEETQTSHRRLTDSLSEAEAGLVRARAALEKRSAELQDIQSRWKVLDEWTREMTGYSQSVRAAIQYARDRGMDGVYGVLAQLIEVPARLETAIDMALGAATQNIVTDQEQTAKRLIDHLRQNRLGRATFLPVSAMRPRTLTPEERRLLNMPGCVGVASELLSYDGRYRSAVENLLGRTVIADNLDHGIEIMRAGRQAFRLVTLSGDVMNPGGSMTGGSVQSRGVSLLTRERELKEMTEALRRGKGELAGLQQNLKAEQEHRDGLRADIAEALNATHQQEIAVARETERCLNAASALEAQRERMEQTRQAVTQLETAMEDIDSQLQGVDASGEGAQTSQEEMERQTQSLQDRLNQARAAAAEVSRRVMDLTLSLSEKRHELDVMRRDSGRYRLDCEQLAHDARRRDSLREQMDQADRQDRGESERLLKEESLRKDDLQRREETVKKLEEQRASEQTRLRGLLSDIEAMHEAIARDTASVHRAELSRTRIENEQRALQDRIWNTYELTYAGAEEFRMEGFREQEADRRVKEIQTQIRALGPVNVHAVEEYAATKGRYDELLIQQQDLRKAEKDLRELIDSLLRQMRLTFVDSFTRLQGYFSETFVRLFGGGAAQLQLMDPDDPLNCGIEVNAQPPGKKLQLLSLLSGGERALTAIAILFAMLKLKPTPFCILDEIEAALDDANIGYYADYLKEYSESTQFIVITHRKGTMERCNSLYGVAMEEQGVSKMVSVALQDYQE